jgi:hypothetical protein
MKKILLVVMAFAMTSCAGFVGSLSTPYGDVSTNNGSVVVTPKPIVIPTK